MDIFHVNLISQFPFSCLSLPVPLGDKWQRFSYRMDA